MTPGNPRNYARLVRIFDEDTATYENALDGFTWLFQNHTVLRRTPSPHGTTKPSCPANGLPIVGVGSNAGRGLVMTGRCRSTEWRPFDDPSGRYKAKIDIDWDNVIYRVPPSAWATNPGRSNAGLTKAEYDAWKQAGTPLTDALQNPLS